MGILFEIVVQQLQEHESAAAPARVRNHGAAIPLENEKRNEEQEAEQSTSCVNG